MWSRSVLHVPAIEMSVEEALVEEGGRQLSLRAPHRPSTTAHATESSIIAGKRVLNFDEGASTRAGGEATCKRRWSECA